VESDCDQDLLFNIQFTGNIKLKGIIIIGANDEQHPKKVRLVFLEVYGINTLF
jgi:hypothetical protein